MVSQGPSAGKTSKGKRYSATAVARVSKCELCFRRRSRDVNAAILHRLDAVRDLDDLARGGVGIERGCR